MESKVLGRKAENKFYTTSLSRCLGRHSEKLQQLTLLDETSCQKNTLFYKYNQAIKKIKSVNEVSTEHEEDEIQAFISSYCKLKHAARSLKQYQISMSVWRLVTLQDLKKVYLYQDKIGSEMIGVLSVEQNKALNQNKKFIESESFYELLQIRIEVQKFIDYLRAELQKEMAHYSKSFLQRLILVLRDPVNLWGTKGWHILTRKKDSKEGVIESTYKLTQLCEDVLSLNALQFQYVSQLKGECETLSHREQDSIKTLLSDPKIQKKLLLKGSLRSDDIEDIQKDWQKVFCHLIKGEHKQQSILTKDIHKLKKKNAKSSMAEFIEQLDAIYDADAAFRCYGLHDSILKTCLELSKSEKSFWGPKTKTLSKSHYKNLVHKVVEQTKVFCSSQAFNISHNDFIQVLHYIDELTLLHQNHEIELSKTDVGKRFLYGLSQIIKLLSQFQTDYLYNHKQDSKLILSYT